MNSRTLQAVVVDAVRARGYLDGWSLEALQGRQVAKLVEEVGELAALLEGAPVSLVKLTPFTGDAELAGEWARQAFDGVRCTGWENAHVVDAGAAVAELADVVVVALVMASLLGEQDLLGRVVRKSLADIGRGRRDGGSVLVGGVDVCADGGAGGAGPGTSE